MAVRTTPALQRSQEVEDILPLLSLQPLELVDDLICFAILALVRFDSLQQIACPAVVEKKGALPDTPEWSCAELIRARATLRDAVRKILAHMVNKKVGEEVRRLVGKRGAWACRGTTGNRSPRDKRRRMAVAASGPVEKGTPIGGGRRVGRRGGRSQHPHEVGKRFDV